MQATLLASLLLASAALGHPQCHDSVTAIGPWTDTSYAPKGDVFLVGDLEIYVARPGLPGDRSKFVVWAHDIFGWHSGHTMQLVDRLAFDTDYTVLLPNLFRGLEWPPPESYEWETSLQYDWYDKISPFVLEQGGSKVGFVGNCWGAYFVLHASVDPLVTCGFSAHPSHLYFMTAFPEESVEQLYVEVNANAAEQYFGNTPEEGEEYRPGGLADQILDVLILDNFEVPCNHGFFSRGNSSDPLVYECIEREYNQMIDFFAEYLN